MTGHFDVRPMSDDEMAMWCRQHMNLMAERGVWSVPRSGLTYQKRGKALVLTVRARWRPGLPVEEGEWKDYQDDDHAETKRQFEAAGFEVRDETVP